jgi:phosphoribosylformylglycinamidine synthase
MVRLTVAEAVMNLMGARITKVTDISLQANWMAPAKLTGEMDRYVRAVEAYSSYTLALEAKQHPSEGIATNGGKDSNSMVDTDQEGDDVRSPLTLIATASAPIDDVRDHVTPDLKARQWGLGQTELLWVRFANWSPALGGSILADVYDQLGNEVPRAPEPQDLMMLKEAMHQQIDLGRILAVHDTSSGLLPCAAEMALSGGVGIMLDLPVEHELLGTAFGEAPSLLLECRSEDLVRLQIELAFHGFLVNHVGCTQQVLELGVSYRGVHHRGDSRYPAQRRTGGW